MSLNGNNDYLFLKNRHVKFFKRCIQILPYSTASYDTSRMTILFFALSGLDLLNAINEVLSEQDKIQIVDWIYSLQVSSFGRESRAGGFRGGYSLASVNSQDKSSSVSQLDCGHIAMTYTALGSLLILGDDLSRVDREGIRQHVKSLQCSDGSFLSTPGGSENDMRFVYCAATVAYILQDFSELNVDSAVKYILRSISFEGGLGEGPFLESHGGSTYCGVAALHLLNKQDALIPSRKEKLVQWLILRQDGTEGGIQGRPNKPSDTCYTFWVGASLKLLGSFDYLNHRNLIQFVLAAQDPITGGLGKFAGVNPDGLHTYLGISGLALIDNEISCLGLSAVDPSLNISNRAVEHLQKLHAEWSLKS